VRGFGTFCPRCGACVRNLRRHLARRRCLFQHRQGVKKQGKGKGKGRVWR
jgi:hypothetical protein